MNNDLRAAILGNTPRRIDPMQKAAVQYIGATFAWNNDIVPLRLENGTLTVAIPPSKYVNGKAEPEIMAAIVKEARGLDEKKIAIRVLPIEQIRERLKLIYPRQATATSDASKVWEKLVAEAVDRRATDVFIRAYDDHSEALLRIDNRLQPSMTAQRLSLDIHDRLIGIFKHRGDVQPENQNLPGDGRMTVVNDGREFDLRIAKLPAGEGHEGASIRFVNLSPTVRTLDTLGVSKSQFEYLQAEVSSPEFFVVIVGPVGAGKSTLAYAIINSLDRKHRNIISLENPIEQRIADIFQVPIDIDETQANERAQMTFSMATRALLRNNPDVVFLGEIRDTETMREGIKLANTGVSLLSTLHCRSALHVVNRMQILGAHPREISDSVTMATSQRLLNRLCQNCKIRTAAISDESRRIADRFGISLSQAIYARNPDGCSQCSDGEIDRIGAFEFLKFSMPMREIIAKDATVQDIARLAFSEGYRPMAVNAIEHLAAGIVCESTIRSIISYEQVLHILEVTKKKPTAGPELDFERRTTTTPPRQEPSPHE